MFRLSCIVSLICSSPASEVDVCQSGVCEASKLGSGMDVDEQSLLGIRRGLANTRRRAPYGQSLVAAVVGSLGIQQGTDQGFTPNVSAVVINLHDRTDRWMHVTSNLTEYAPWLSFKRMEGVDGRTNPPSTEEVSQTWNTANMAALVSSYKPAILNMSSGERGCCASHIHAWQMASKMSHPLLVMEDDAIIFQNFTDGLRETMQEAPNDTDFIFLTNMDRGAPTLVSEMLMKPYFAWTTVGYIVYPAGAQKLLRMLPMDMPVDNWLAWKLHLGKLNAFSVRKTLFKQADMWINSDVSHSDKFISGEAEETARKIQEKH